MPYRRVRNAVVGAATAYGFKKLAQVARQRKRVYTGGKVKSTFARKLLPPTVQKVTPFIRTPRVVKKFQTYVGMSPSTGNELSTYKKSVGKYPKLSPNRLLKLMKSGMNETVLRAQGITQFDTNVGYYALANRGATDIANDVLIPIHVWDLTNFQNQSQAVAGHAFRWNGVGSTVDILRNQLPTTNADGSVENNGYYEIEKTSGGTAFAYPNAKNACHEWSDIRLNLYGARKRGTMFYIDILRVKNELAHPIAAGLANTELKQLFQQWQSKLIYSNLQTYNRSPLKGIQIIRSFKFYVPGGSADDLDTIGKVKEFKLFLKQGNVYDMSWDTSTTSDEIGHNIVDGQDFTDTWQTVNSPRPSSRLMMVIRAFSPERKTGTTASWNAGGGIIMAPADPLTEPSYDLIIRNKWLLP